MNYIRTAGIATKIDNKQQYNLDKKDITKILEILKKTNTMECSHNEY